MSCIQASESIKTKNDRTIAIPKHAEMKMGEYSYEFYRRSTQDIERVYSITYNNNFQATIEIARFEVLYEKWCRSPLC